MVWGSKKLVLFPSTGRFFVNPYDDRVVGGNSSLFQFETNREHIQYRFVLQNGLQYPFAGIDLVQQNWTIFDISAYQKLRVTMKNDTEQKINIQLRLFLPGFTRTDSLSTYRYIVKEIYPTNILKTYTLPLKQFLTPVWWYDLNRVPEESLGKADFRRLFSITFANGELHPLNLTDRLEITGITLEKDYSQWLISLLVLFVLSSLGFGAAILQKKLSEKKIKVIIAGNPQELTNQMDKESKTVMDFLIQNYNNPDMTLGLINKQTGIAEKKVGKIIQNSSGLTFKQYLNQIRIEEARRQLLHTDRSITEIAFLVGYNNVTHFNRIFKELQNISPKEFRNQA